MWQPLVVVTVHASLVLPALAQAQVAPPPAPPMDSAVPEVKSQPLTLVLHIRGGRAEILRTHAGHATRRVERLLEGAGLVVRAAPRGAVCTTSSTCAELAGTDADALVWGSITLNDSGWTLVLTVWDAKIGQAVDTLTTRGRRFLDVGAALEGADGERLLAALRRLAPNETRTPPPTDAAGARAAPPLVIPTATAESAPEPPGAEAPGPSPETEPAIPLVLETQPVPRSFRPMLNDPGGESGERRPAATRLWPQTHSDPTTRPSARPPTPSDTKTSESDTRALPASFTAEIGPTTALRRWVVRSPPQTLYDGQLAAEHEVPLYGAQARMTTFPLTRTQGPWRLLGAEVGYSRAVGWTELGAEAPRTWSTALTYGAIVHLPGERVSGSVRASVVHQWLSIIAPQSETLQPNFAYTSASLGFAGALQITDQLATDLDARFRPLLSAGEREGQLQNARWFPETSGYGWSVDLALSLWLSPLLGLRLTGSVAEYQLKFDEDGTHNLTAGALLSPQADGASDTYVAGTLAAMMRID